MPGIILNQGERITFSRLGTKYEGDRNAPLYNKTYSGNSLNMIFLKNHRLPTDIDPANFIGRGASFNWSETYNIMPVVEYNTYFIQEQVIGLQELGRGGLDTFEILHIGDNLPSVKTLAFESEITALEVVGEDHPQHGTVLNAFYGCLVTQQSGSFNPTALAQRSFSISYRYRLPGKDYKALVPSSNYPGNVKPGIPLDV